MENELEESNEEILLLRRENEQLRKKVQEIKDWAEQIDKYLPIPKNYLGAFSNEIRRQGDEQDHEEMLYKSTTDNYKGSKALATVSILNHLRN
ncbi:hypothetical protein BpHYR1_006176 [Brachionus plicatilis]|uniref:Uncharacterized protein n=1 Tax=Brachionus plicatilis TaxID=10195 RepID=A0A3M7P3Y9_BRAPC|nr:hypothetical protein BpHYR1_006176 [Brachionus plicatilis]